MRTISFSMLKGRDKLETMENYFVLFIFIGAMTLSGGIGFSIVNAKGFGVILAMIGALVSFVSTILLIVVWSIREFAKESQE